MLILSKIINLIFCFKNWPKFFTLVEVITNYLPKIDFNSRPIQIIIDRVKDVTFDPLILVTLSWNRRLLSSLLDDACSREWVIWFAIIAHMYKNFDILHT